jgi:hypothetical protein
MSPPTAHAAHVVIDLVVFLGPVTAIAVALVIANLRGRHRS